MAYLYLLIAIVAEVVATSALKSSEGFTRLGPSILVVVGYGCAFYLLSLAIRTIPLGVAYAIWSGIGIALVSTVGALFFQQKLDLPAVVGMGLIIVGIAVMNIFSHSTPH